MSRPARLAARYLALLSLVVTSGCAAGLPLTKEPLATSLRDLVPHNDRDHLVYLVERPSEQGFVPSSLQVEHVTKLEAAGEYEVTLSEDGMGTGRVMIRDDGKSLVLVREDDYTRGVSMSYDPPLPYLSVPLYASKVDSVASVSIRKMSDGQATGRMQVTQVTEASAAPAGEWLTGMYGSGVQLQTERTLQTLEGPQKLTSTMVLVPGIGEVKSEGSVNGMMAMRRTLACAIIANRPIGDCRTLFGKFK